MLASTQKIVKRQRSWVLDDIAETLKEPTLIVKGN